MAYRIGILGAGNISETHARAAHEILGVEIVAVHGANPEKAAALAGRYGATAYAELEGFLRHRPLDVVLIGSPSGVHAAQAIAAARAGLHVLVEKPLDISTARIDELLAECARAGTKLGVFYQDRTAPELAWLKRLLERGELGPVFLASARVKWFRPPEYYAGSRWRGTWELDGGGALMNQGIHTVDLLLWLLGDVQRVFALTRTVRHAIEVEDTVVATLEFAGGAVATLEATTAAYPGFPRQLELSGAEGTIGVADDRIAFVELRAPPGEPRPAGDPVDPARASSAAIAKTRGHRAIIEDFLRAVADDGTPLCDGRDGRRSVAVVEAIYRSAREGVPAEP